MRKIRIVLGSDDGKTLILDHLGEAKNFFVYDVFENGNFEFIEKRKNNLLNIKNHGDENKLKKASEIFKDADVVMSRRLSPNFIKMRDNTAIQPVLTKTESITDSIKELIKSFNKIYELISKRKNNERPEEIPEIGK